MLTLRRGRITAIVERHEGLARLEVDGTPCIAYPHTTGPVALGDDVLVNEQARTLRLGSGGFDVLYANLTRGLGLPAEIDAHVMKLPYTPGQFATRHAEEGRAMPDGLSGLPVVCCSLHSQVAPVAAALGDGVRVAYVQIPGGALPVPLSDTVRALRRRHLLDVAVAVGACVDGDVRCVSLASALVWAVAEEVDAVVCSVGPGIVGTGSFFGHGGASAGEAVNVVEALGGSAVLAVRASQADRRERHLGVSHHSRAALALCLRRPAVAWPRGWEAPNWLYPREEVDVSGWEAACADLPLSHMGRGPDEDALFFAAAFAAGSLARRQVG